jgi:hypothetical protein
MAFYDHVGHVDHVGQTFFHFFQWTRVGDQTEGDDPLGSTDSCTDLFGLYHHEGHEEHEEIRGRIASRVERLSNFIFVLFVHFVVFFLVYNSTKERSSNSIFVHFVVFFHQSPLPNNRLLVGGILCGFVLRRMMGINAGINPSPRQLDIPNGTSVGCFPSDC